MTLQTIIKAYKRKIPKINICNNYVQLFYKNVKKFLND